MPAAVPGRAPGGARSASRHPGAPQHHSGTTGARGAPGGTRSTAAAPQAPGARVVESRREKQKVMVRQKSRRRKVPPAGYKVHRKILINK